MNNLCFDAAKKSNAVSFKNGMDASVGSVGSSNLAIGFEKPPPVKFNRTQLAAVLEKDSKQRTEKDVEEALELLMKLDFIRNLETSLESKDLLEMAKSATVHEYEAGRRIIKQGDEASYMLFILQGHCSASYALASKDKQAQYLGKV